MTEFWVVYVCKDALKCDTLLEFWTKKGKQLSLIMAPESYFGSVAYKRYFKFFVDI